MQLHIKRLALAGALSLVLLLPAAAQFLGPLGGGSGGGGGSSDITVGSTAVLGGNTGRVLFDNGAVVGEYVISGTVSVCMTTSCVMTTPNLGTPSAATLTNATGLPIATGVSGLGTGVATFLATPSSANLATAVTGETGTGALVFATSPTLVTPALGTPSSGTLTNATGLPVATGISGLGTGVATALAVNVGSAGAPVLLNGALGTPSSGTLTNATGLPLATGVTGTLPAANGGTGNASYTKGDLLGASAATTLTKLAVGANGTVLTADSGEATGLKWVAAAGGLTVGTTTITSGTTTRVLFDNAGVLGEYVISGTGNVAMTTSPTFVTPTLGVATGTSLALGACTIGANSLCTAANAAVAGDQLTVKGRAIRADLDSFASIGVTTNFVAYNSASIALNGLFDTQQNFIVIANGGGGDNYTVMNAGMRLAWSSTAQNAGTSLIGTIDTAAGRNAAGVTEFTNGTANAYREAKLRSLIVGGTVPGISGCSAGTQAGGATAGTYVSGTTGACAVTLTFAFTAPTGWNCAVSNQTTANLIRQSGGSTTTAVLTGVTVTSDVISFSCMAF